MNLLAPTALALLSLAIPILLLWMLKLRRREVTVASTMLWSKLLRDREANAPWQRLRRNLLLLLQLAILVALVLALARPFIPVPVVASGAVVVMLDASASMNATDTNPSRFELAQRAALELVDNLAASGLMTVISVGRQPQILAAASNDRSVLRAAIDAAAPGQAPADWKAALALARGAARGVEETTTVIISDGNLPPDIPALPGEVRYLPIGRSPAVGGTENLAITALATRLSANGPELFVNIANTSPADNTATNTALLSIYLDGALYESRHIQVSPGENLPLTLSNLPAGTTQILAQLTIDDALALDDTAWAIQSGQQELARRALMVSESNFFLERVLTSLPEIDAFRVDPAAPLPAEAYDLYLFDGALPAPEQTLPAGPLLIINPPAGHPLLEVSGTFSNTQLSRIAEHPLLSYVDLSQVQILAAKRIERPDWAEVLVSAQGGPLLLVGETNGRRVAVLTFDLRDSDLPLQIAFPVLMSNLVAWLTPGAPFDAANGLQPGEPLVIYPGEAQTVQVTLPDGSHWQQAVTAGTVIFSETDQLGIYRVALDGVDSGHFAVNMFDPAESTLTRQESITVGRTEIDSQDKQALGQRELWPWLAAAALLILLIEWWLFHQGSRWQAKRNPR